jgi:hypothetical protein
MYMDDVYYGNDYLEDAYEEDDGYYWKKLKISNFLKNKISFKKFIIFKQKLYVFNKL